MKRRVSLGPLPEIHVDLLLEEGGQDLGGLEQDADVERRHADGIGGVDIDLRVFCGDELLEELEVVAAAGEEELLLCSWTWSRRGGTGRAVRG